MKVGILGATGPTGTELVTACVAAGHSTSAYVRSPAKLGKIGKLNVIEGLLTDQAKLANWAKNQDVVLNALGHKQIGKSILFRLGVASYPEENFMSNAIAILLDAAKNSSLKKIIHCSAYGTGATNDDLPFVFGKILKPLLLPLSYSDHERCESLLEKSSLDWVVALPGMLTNGPKTGVYRAQERFQDGKTIQISRADVAHFMVRAISESQFNKKRIGLGY